MTGFPRNQVLEALPEGSHPMTQLSVGITALQPSSKFAAAYQAGIHKTKYWDPVYEASDPSNNPSSNPSNNPSNFPLE